MESIGQLSPDAQTRSGGAGVTVLAGAGAAGPDWSNFGDLYLNPGNPGDVVETYTDALLAYLQQAFGYQGGEAGALAFFQRLPAVQQSAFLLQVYFDELRDSGREFTDSSSVRFKSYVRGRRAIAALFPAGRSTSGDITLFGGSGVRSDFGGTVSLLAPGGAGSCWPPPRAARRASTAGVLTQGQGDVYIYALGSVLLGQSRVFTTFGGSIVVWSANGDINAGQGANSTDVFSSSSTLYDAFGNVALAPSVPTTGAGIATLAPISGIAAGDVDLIAPLGVIDAGEAGIRVSGNANLAALTVVNAANVQVGGRSSGLPTVVAPNVGALSSASSASGGRQRGRAAIREQRDRGESRAGRPAPLSRWTCSASVTAPRAAAKPAASVGQRSSQPLGIEPDRSRVRRLSRHDSQTVMANIRLTVTGGAAFGRIGVAGLVLRRAGVAHPHVPRKPLPSSPLRSPAAGLEPAGGEMRARQGDRFLVVAGHRCRVHTLQGAMKQHGKGDRGDGEGDDDLQQCEAGLFSMVRQLRPRARSRQPP